LKKIYELLIWQMDTIQRVVKDFPSASCKTQQQQALGEVGPGELSAQKAGTPRAEQVPGNL